MSKQKPAWKAKVASAARDLARAIEEVGSDPVLALDRESMTILDVVRLMCRGVVSIINDRETPHA